MFRDEEEKKTYLAVLIDFSELMPILTDIFHIRGQGIQDILDMATNMLAGKKRKEK
jgi:hypothetical protein